MTHPGNSSMGRTSCCCVALLLVLQLAAAQPAQPAQPVPAYLGGTTASDAAVLLKLQDALGAKQKGWAGDNPCGGTWAGVGCSPAGRVTTLNLARAGLAGPLPPFLTELTNLQTLNMSNNALTGGVPIQYGWKDIFPLLQVLSLENNKLTGDLPWSFGQPGALASLLSLNLNGNGFSGQLPVGWGQTGAFPTLRVLSVRENKLSGALPDSWGNQTGAYPTLSVLDIGGNDLKGALPGGWAAGFRSLTFLGLANNSLWGGAPPAWGAAGAWPKLQITTLQGNLLAGSLPPEWAAKTAFPAMRGRGNGIILAPGNGNLTGPLPAGAGYSLLRYQDGVGFLPCMALPCEGKNVMPLALAPKLAPALAPAPAPLAAAAPVAAPLPAPMVAPTLAPAPAPLPRLPPLMAPAPAPLAAKAPLKVAAPAPEPLAPQPLPTAVAPAVPYVPLLAPEPSAAAPQGTTVVATYNLVGSGVYPLSPAAEAALLSSIKSSLSSQGKTVTSVTLGNVTDLATATPAPAFQAMQAPQQAGQRQRRLLAATQEGAQAQVLIGTAADAGKAGVDAVVAKLAGGVRSGQLGKDLSAAGLPVDSVSLGRPAASPAPAPAQAPAAGPAVGPVQAASPRATVPVPDPSSSSSGSGIPLGLSLAGFVGVVVGCVLAVILLLALAAWCCCCRSRNSSFSKTGEASGAKPLPVPQKGVRAGKARGREEHVNSSTMGLLATPEDSPTKEPPPVEPLKPQASGTSRTAPGPNKTGTVSYNAYKQSRLDKIRQEIGVGTPGASVASSGLNTPQRIPSGNLGAPRPQTPLPNGSNRSGSGPIPVRGTRMESPAPSPRTYNNDLYH